MARSLAIMIVEDEALIRMALADMLVEATAGISTSSRRTRPVLRSRLGCPGPNAADE